MNGFERVSLPKWKRSPFSIPLVLRLRNVGLSKWILNPFGELSHVVIMLMCVSQAMSINAHCFFY